MILSNRFLSDSFLVCAVFLFSVFSQAFEFKKVTVFSDIDDTIKISHVLSNPGAIGRAANVTVPFTGMSELYQLLHQQNQTEFIYLSNALDEVLGLPAFRVSHQTFLDVNHFPEGELILRQSILDQNHKLNQLRKFLNQNNSDLVILVGDNGERDAEVYHQIIQEYPTVRFITFIHQIYNTNPAPFFERLLTTKIKGEVGKKIFPEQVGFVTSMEMALELYRQQAINDSTLSWMIENVMPRIVQETELAPDMIGEAAFPLFLRCQDFKWQWTFADQQLNNAIQPLRQKLENKCN